MLSTLVKAASSAQIQFVGGYAAGFVGSSSNIIITFGGNLTGGLSSSASAGDIVVVYFGVGAESDEVSNISGYTEIAQLAPVDTYVANLSVGYKFMGVTPDTTFTLIGGTASSRNAGAVVVQVWRGVDTVLPLGVNSTTATGINSVLCNPPAITPIAQGSVIVSGGAGAHVDGTQTFSSSDLSGFLSVGANDDTDVTVGAGYLVWNSGSFNPAAFTFSGTSATTNSWAAVTLALQPIYTGPTPTFIAQESTQSTLASTSSVVVNKPTGTIEGDLMIMLGATGSLARTWTGDTGWTEVADQNASPNLRIAYKVAGASEPADYTFTLSSPTTNGAAASILTYRGAAYDTIGTFTTGTNPLVLPSISPSVSFSRLIAAGARGAASITLGTPTDMTARVTDNDATAPSYKVCDQLVTAGATGTRSMSTGSTTSVSGLLLSLKPA